MELIFDLLVWFSIFFVVEGSAILMQNKNISFITHFYIYVPYFIAASLITLALFTERFSQFFSDKFLVPMIIMLISFIIGFLSYSWAKRFRTKAAVESSEFDFFRLDERYLITEIFEVIFQQIMILFLLSILLEYGIGTFHMMSIFVLIFVMTHAPMIFLIDKRVAVGFTIAAIPGSIIFISLILFADNGIFYSISLHFLSYAMLGVLYWIYKDLQKHHNSTE